MGIGDVPCGGRSVFGSGTKSEGEDDVNFMVPKNQFRKTRKEPARESIEFPTSTVDWDCHTWTSFSFNDTRWTISRRACLSGLGLLLYASSRIILSLALHDAIETKLAQLLR